MDAAAGEGDSTWSEPPSSSMRTGPAGVGTTACRRLSGPGCGATRMREKPRASGLTPSSPQATAESAVAPPESNPGVPESPRATFGWRHSAATRQAAFGRCPAADCNRRRGWCRLPCRALAVYGSIRAKSRRKCKDGNLPSSHSLQEGLLPPGTASAHRFMTRRRFALLSRRGPCARLGA